MNEVLTGEHPMAIVDEMVWSDKHGMKYLCLCPFHEEKTPSMVVYVKDRTFHCIGCGAKGDVVAGNICVQAVELERKD